MFIGDGWTDFKTAQTASTHFVLLREMSDWDKCDEQMLGAAPASVSRLDTWEDLLARVTLA